MKHYFVLGMIFLLLLFTRIGQAQERLDLSAQIPIVAWYGIRANEATVERFKELKEAGFTINFSEYSSLEEVEKALDAAHKVGVQLIIACPELRKEPEKTVRKFMEHPAVAGYFLRDEPVVTDFAALGDWAKRIQAVDNRKFCYLNLFPTGGEEHLRFLGVQNYREYITRFNKEVPLPFLSFDHYPVLGDNVLKAEWYENLEDFSDEARKIGKDFWAFALATKHGPYPVPTRASLRLQLYSNLVYGAQGLQYFTYWTPAGDSFYDFCIPPYGTGIRHCPNFLCGSGTGTSERFRDDPYPARYRRYHPLHRHGSGCQRDYLCPHSGGAGHREDGAFFHEDRFP